MASVHGEKLISPKRAVRVVVWLSCLLFSTCCLRLSIICFKISLADPSITDSSAAFSLPPSAEADAASAESSERAGRKVEEDDDRLSAPSDFHRCSFRGVAVLRFPVRISSLWATAPTWSARISPFSSSRRCQIRPPLGCGPPLRYPVQRLPTCLFGFPQKSQDPLSIGHRPQQGKDSSRGGNGRFAYISGLRRSGSKIFLWINLKDARDGYETPPGLSSTSD